MKKSRIILIKYICLALLFSASVTSLYAQWQTQEFTLKPGWNAIYTNIDAKHTTIEELTLNTQIEEVWMWKPKLSTLQYIQSPEEPLITKRWIRWKKNDSNGSTLNRMIGNSAYLVKSTDPQLWSVKGKPVPPRMQWTSTGLNFIGFSTDSNNPPIFTNFLAPVNQFGTSAQIFSYQGGPLSSNNPKEIFNFNNTLVNRGEAYWIRANGYNRYYGPFEINLQDSQGVLFDDNLSSYDIILKNKTENELTVTMELLDSEPSPIIQGVTNIVGTPPVIVKGPYNFETLLFDYVDLNKNIQSWTLQPNGQTGDTVKITLGVHWAKLNGVTGDFFAGILRFQDSLGHLQTDLPLSAIKPDTSGLWVGGASITHVRHDKKVYKTSQFNGKITANRSSTDSNPITVNWLKKQATQVQESNFNYQSSDLGYHLIQSVSYPNYSSGEILPIPKRDENGSLLENPDNYWQQKPSHESFVNGWYYISSSNEVISTGDKERIEIQYLKREIPNFPSGSTVEKVNNSWFYITDISYQPATAGSELKPPSNDENGNILNNPSNYWEVYTGTQLNDGTPSWSIGESGVYSKITQNILIRWKKIRPEDDIYENFQAANENSPTLVKHQYKTVSVSVLPEQRLTKSQILPSTMPVSQWFIVNTPNVPDYTWVGESEKTESGGNVISHAVSNWDKVDRPMNLRVIIHNNPNGVPKANLLQRVYLGIDKNIGEQLISNNPNYINSVSDEIQRISSIHLPWSKNNLPWDFVGSFKNGGTIDTTIFVRHDDHASNPFLHTYHPDHDNLDNRFAEKSKRGEESYDIRRDVSIRLNGSQPGFRGLALGGNGLSGEYEERIELIGKSKQSGGGDHGSHYHMKGFVTFNRIIKTQNLMIK